MLQLGLSISIIGTTYLPVPQKGPRPVIFAMNTFRESPDQSAEAAETGSEPENARQPQFSFEQLAQGSNEILIDFQGQTYRLRLTKHNKLILNK